jgi:MFS family permease
VVLFFLHSVALSMWFVPLSTVLDAHSLQGIKSFAFAASAVACFVSPLIFGAMADHHVAPVRVLRWLAVATAAAMALAATAIQFGWNPWLVLLIIQVHALCSAPTWSISTTIVLARLTDARHQFGPVRAMATLGWMAGCWLVSALHADASTLSGYGGAVAWLIVAGFTYVLPAVAPPNSGTRLTVRQRLGLDALSLLRNSDHRVVFVTAALFSIPLAAFYPYTPTHLRELGLTHTAAWMTLGQTTEVVAMFGLGALLLRWRLKWILVAGLSFGVLRFALCALDGRGWVLAGTTMHGFSYTLVYITTQLYLEERIDSKWRARAQALLSLMLGGVGSLAGYLGCGWWFHAAHRGDTVHWPLFWAGLSLACAAVLLYFLGAYQGVGKVHRHPTQAIVGKDLPQE